MSEHDLYGPQPTDPDDDADVEPVVVRRHGSEATGAGAWQTGWPTTADEPPTRESDADGPAWSPSSDSLDPLIEQRKADGTFPVYTPPPLPPPTAEHHSRNPVDRLFRGLPRGLRITLDWIVTIVGAVAIVLLIKAFVVNPYRIPSSSMESTLHCAQPASGCEARFSDRVLANRFIYHLREPRRGDIVVFETPPKAQERCGAGGTFVKRLIGLPGETLEVRLIKGDAYVFINGRQLNEPYIDKDRRQFGSTFGPVKIPEGRYFMMGDNREASCDSREWGAVPRENLIGKVFATYWPPNRLSLH